MLKELGSVVIFALLAAGGVVHAVHSGQMCVAHMQKVAQLMKRGDPPKQSEKRE
jgi:hypothetical protein